MSVVYIHELQSTAATSTIGSTNGNINLRAKTYRQSGSDVLAPSGDINIAAQQVSIEEAREAQKLSLEQRVQQSGLTLSLTNPVVSTVQSVQQQQQAATHTQSSRLRALAAANAALSSKQALDAVQAARSQPDANAADQVGGVSLNLSLGSSQSQSQSLSSSNSARGSNVRAGGQINIQATGAGADSDLTIQGSSITATGKTRLKADGQIDLLAAQNSSEQSNSNSASSASAGLTMRLGKSSGAGLTASASRGAGQGTGSDTYYSNSRISGQEVSLESGGDTRLKGALIQGQRIQADIGGDLLIQSLQSSSRYGQGSYSVSASGLIGTGAGGNVNLAQSQISSEYRSTTEQSAMRAGDEGFQIQVRGKSELKAGQITSTQAAIDNNKNRYSAAGGTSSSDLQNSASYEAKSTSVGLGAGSSLPGQSLSSSLSGVGLGKDSASAQSTTKAAISGIAGDKAARTGDKETGIKPIFDLEQAKREIEAQVTITQEFGRQASSAVASYADNQRKALRELALKASTPEEKTQAEQAIKDVNMQERALNILVGALTGNGQAMLTKESLGAAAEKMRDLMIEDSKKFAGVVDRDGKPLFSNQSGQSEGIRGDQFKLGGTRVDLDLLCGPNWNRCSYEKNPDGSRDTSKPVKFLGEKVENKDGTEIRKSFDDFLETADGKKMLGPTGGIQGQAGTFFGHPYAPGSWMDKLVESFAGSHDFIGGKLSGLYDKEGNIKTGMSPAEIETYNNVVTTSAIVPAAPFAAAEGTSPEVWKAIGILIKAGR